MAALASGSILKKDKDYPKPTFGVWSFIPYEIQWSTNSSGDTATIAEAGKCLGVIGGGHISEVITNSANGCSIVLTSKAASLGTKVILLWMEVGR